MCWNDAQAQHHNINIEADVFSGSLSYNYKLNRYINVGSGYKIGTTHQFAYLQNTFFQQLEFGVWVVYNRFEFHPFFHLDVGVKWSDIGLIDGNPRHGFSHFNYIGGFLKPMIGWKNLKLGSAISIGRHKDTALVLNNLMLRYTFKFNLF